MNLASSGASLTCPNEARIARSALARARAPLAGAALDLGARTIMILGGEPTIHLPAALDIVAALPDDARLVWKTNAHASAQARALLDGLFDLWLADYKFGNDLCAQRLSRTPR